MQIEKPALSLISLGWKMRLDWVATVGFLMLPPTRQSLDAAVGHFWQPSLGGGVLQGHLLQERKRGTSLVAQWLRIRLPIQGTRVRALVREDPKCRGATKPCAATSEPVL